MLKYRLQRVLDSNAQDIYVGTDVVGTIYQEGEYWRGVSYEPDVILPPRWTQSEAAGDVMKLWDAVQRAQRCEQLHLQHPKQGQELRFFENVTQEDIAILVVIAIIMALTVIGMVFG